MSKLKFETDFNDKNQTSCNSPVSPARDGSSGRDRNTISEAAVGFTGGLGRDRDGPGRNDSERRNDNQRRNHIERQNDSRDKSSFRDNLRYIAQTTLQTLNDGEYFPPGQDGPYDLKVKIRWTEENTRYYGPDAGEGGEISESEFIKINSDERKEETKHGLEKATAAAAASKPDGDDNANSRDRTRVQATASDLKKKATLDNAQTPIFIGEYSTLVGARKFYLQVAQNTDPSVNKKIGVLNFASAKRPGGGFINGSQAQVGLLKLSLYDINLMYPLIRKSPWLARLRSILLLIRRPHLNSTHTIMKTHVMLTIRTPWFILLVSFFFETIAENGVVQSKWMY
jgi:hypothetical protein